ncbi:dihydroorotase [Bacillus shivajii]|uniref:dihydroorotase n=1 Tax=Bacillus shivajii TaxID=1983719 RepID=UPI001CFA5183|nr:dihydroorotase [Bacillus shivajii]UCZ51800.1 dihydroorotase [Bacillus shivajii]
MKVLYKNGRTITETGEIIEINLVVDKKTKAITEIGECRDDSHYNEVIDVGGKLVVPGLVDLHVHLREPGGEKKETIETGSLAAARGGFTTIAAMPNTRPVPDTKENFAKINDAMKTKGHVRILPYAAITERQLGETITRMDELVEEGAFAFTDDGVGVQEAGKMYEAMQSAAKLNKPIVAHCEDNSLLYGGAVHKGKFSERTGIPGILSVSESVHIARDALLAEATGAHYHICHVSTKESVRVIRDAKKAGINVTAEVSPHHLILSEDDIPGNDANYKMNPPLRSSEDREALLNGLLDGTIDFIATDHAPHTEEEKSSPMEEAPFGIVGLEIAFPLLYTKLVKTNQMTLQQLIYWLTEAPANTFNLPFGTLKEGTFADFTIINLEKELAVNKDEFLSKGKNTPFDGERLSAWPVATIFEGEIAWQEKGAL